MPVTPFHLGPGAAFKAVGGRHFSFMVFGGAQVLMDIEPLVRIYLGTPVLHGYTHTLLGALVIGLVATLTGKPISQFVLNRYRIPHHPFTWLAAGVGAFVGTFSHVVLDAIMHPDMHPWWPISQGNALLGIVSVGWLHVGCVALGMLGGLVIAFRIARRGRA
jgi:membrane-bound metal-dependent hydrolase YbcI (DUF457 family)